jgi:hypothetical protein
MNNLVHSPSPEKNSRAAAGASGAKAQAFPAVAPFQLQTAVIQRKLVVDFKTTSNGFTLNAKGRPDWSSQAKKRLTPGPKQSRGHIIEWSTRSRAYVNSLRALSKRQLTDALGLDSRAADATIQTAIHTNMKEMYNDLTNLSLNDTEEDNEAGGEANRLAQLIDLQKEGPEKTALLKELYNHSFNPGSDGRGIAKFPEYQRVFAQAWGVAEDVVKSWPNKWVSGAKSGAAEDEKKTPIEARTTTTTTTVTNAPTRVVPPVVAEIANGIESLQAQKIILEGYLSDQLVDTTVKQRDLALFVQTARLLATKIMDNVVSGVIPDSLGERMMSDLGDTVPSLR